MKQDTFIHIRVSQKQKEELKKLASLHGVTLTSYILQMVYNGFIGGQYDNTTCVHCDINGRSIYGE